MPSSRHNLRYSDKTYLDLYAKFREALPGVPDNIYSQFAGIFETLNDTSNLIALDVIQGLTARSIYAKARQVGLVVGDKQPSTIRLYITPVSTTDMDRILDYDIGNRPFSETNTTGRYTFSIGNNSGFFYVVFNRLNDNKYPTYESFFLKEDSSKEYSSLDNTFEAMINGLSLGASEFTAKREVYLGSGLNNIVETSAFYTISSDSSTIDAPSQITINSEDFYYKIERAYIDVDQKTPIKFSQTTTLKPTLDVKFEASDLVQLNTLSSYFNPNLNNVDDQVHFLEVEIPDSIKYIAKTLKVYLINVSTSSGVTGEFDENRDERVTGVFEFTTNFLISSQTSALVYTFFRNFRGNVVVILAVPNRIYSENGDNVIYVRGEQTEGFIVDQSGLSVSTHTNSSNLLYDFDNAEVEIKRNGVEFESLARLKQLVFSTVSFTDTILTRKDAIFVIQFLNKFVNKVRLAEDTTRGIVYFISHNDLSNFFVKEDEDETELLMLVCALKERTLFGTVEIEVVGFRGKQEFRRIYDDVSVDITNFKVLQKSPNIRAVDNILDPVLSDEFKDKGRDYLLFPLILFCIFLPITSNDNTYFVYIDDLEDVNILDITEKFLKDIKNSEITFDVDATEDSGKVKMGLDELEILLRNSTLKPIYQTVLTNIVRTWSSIILNERGRSWNQNVESAHISTLLTALGVYGLSSHHINNISATHYNSENLSAVPETRNLTDGVLEIGSDVGSNDIDTRLSFLKNVKISLL